MEPWRDVAARRAAEAGKREGRAPIMKYFFEYWGIYDKDQQRRLAGIAIALGALFAAIGVGISLKP